MCHRIESCCRRHPGRSCSQPESILFEAQELCHQSQKTRRPRRKLTQRLTEAEEDVFVQEASLHKDLVGAANESFRHIFTDHIIEKDSFTRLSLADQAHREHSQALTEFGLPKYELTDSEIMPELQSSSSDTEELHPKPACPVSGIQTPYDHNPHDEPPSGKFWDSTNSETSSEAPEGPSAVHCWTNTSTIYDSPAQQYDTMSGSSIQPPTPNHPRELFFNQESGTRHAILSHSFRGYNEMGHYFVHDLEKLARSSLVADKDNEADTLLFSFIFIFILLPSPSHSCQSININNTKLSIKFQEITVQSVPT